MLPEESELPPDASTPPVIGSPLPHLHQQQPPPAPTASQRRSLASQTSMGARSEVDGKELTEHSFTSNPASATPSVIGSALSGGDLGFLQRRSLRHIDLCESIAAREADKHLPGWRRDMLAIKEMVVGGKVACHTQPWASTSLGPLIVPTGQCLTAGAPQLLSASCSARAVGCHSCCCWQTMYSVACSVQVECRWRPLTCHVSLHMQFGSWLSVLLVCAPLGAASALLQWGAVPTFVLVGAIRHNEHCQHSSFLLLADIHETQAAQSPSGL